MKKLTYEEFNDRLRAFNEAERIFVATGLTNNITDAFRAYQAILAEKERALHAAPSEHGFIPGSQMNKYERPQCPDCGSYMGFRIVPENDEGVKTQLVCQNAACGLVLDSELTMQEWQEKLRIRKDEPGGLPEDAQKA
jgi:hypothetical protein